jgi:hypothetical protein
LSLDKLHVISIDSVAVEGDTVAIVVFDVEELFELAIETFLFRSVLIEHSFFPIYEYKSEDFAILNYE